MDKLERYRQAIKQIITESAVGGRSNAVEYETQVVFDDQRGHYFLYGVGWLNEKRIHGCTLHFDLKADKIWVQEDWTEEGAASKLEALGVPKSDIVLAFRSPYIREYTGYAVA